MWLFFRRNIKFFQSPFSAILNTEILRFGRFPTSLLVQSINFAKKKPNNKIVAVNLYNSEINKKIFNDFWRIFSSEQLWVLRRHFYWLKSKFWMRVVQFWCLNLTYILSSTVDFKQEKVQSYKNTQLKNKYCSTRG